VESFKVKTDFDLQGDCLVWYALPQLFFNYTLCPAGAKGDSSTHKELSLVYFNTFEPIELTPDSIMQRPGLPMLYDSASKQRVLLHLPGGKRAGARPPHSVLRQRQPSPHYPTPLQGRSAS
jgi:hypothetical protein